MASTGRLTCYLLLRIAFATLVLSQQKVLQTTGNLENAAAVDARVPDGSQPAQESGGETPKQFTVAATIRDAGIIESHPVVEAAPNAGEVVTTAAPNATPEAVVPVAPVVQIGAPPTEEPASPPPHVETANPATQTANVTRNGGQGGPEADNKDTMKPKGILHRFVNWILDVIRTDFNLLISSGTVLSSLLTQLIPLHTIMTIRWNKSTGSLKTLNFVTVAFANFLWSVYGTLSYNRIIFLSSVPGFLLNCCYIAVFHRNCQDEHQMRILRIFYKVSGVSCVILFIGYLGIEGEPYLKFIGLFGGSIQAFSYVAPLFSIREIMKNKSTSAMPTEISLANFIGSFFTLCYGFIIWDYIVIAPNFIGMVSGIIQIVLLMLISNNERIVVAEKEILDKQHFKPILKTDVEV
ncbi:MtN3/saliva family protein [Babesia caballi]|uniref:MtN3/saliva family protein n=1 Tax=Babesia caballi TaxID=5871 RepID=A0AAV4M311_BABCB|nr:MtN3/saliva family protein [Babesia caballi]